MEEQEDSTLYYPIRFNDFPLKLNSIEDIDKHQFLRVGKILSHQSRNLNIPSNPDFLTEISAELIPEDMEAKMKELVKAQLLATKARTDYLNYVRQNLKISQEDIDKQLIKLYPDLLL
jgi:hypothetical protein